MTNTLTDALQWINETSLGDDDLDKDVLVNFLTPHYPGEDFTVYTAGHLVSRTYLTSILLEHGTRPAALGPDTALARARSLLGRHGEDTSAMDAAELAWLHCRDPQLNSLPASDLVTRDQDNVLCSAALPCHQTLHGGLHATEVSVGGDLVAGSEISVFNMDLLTIGNNLVSLSSPQQLSGTYNFSSLTIGSGGFSGDIQYQQGAEPRPLHALCSRLLHSALPATQTFTQAATLGQLSAGQGVTTGAALTLASGDLSIADIYGASFLLDAAENNINVNNLNIGQPLNVTKGVEVEGNVHGIPVRQK